MLLVVCVGRLPGQYRLRRNRCEQSTQWEMHRPRPLSLSARPTFQGTFQIFITRSRTHIHCNLKCEMPAANIITTVHLARVHQRFLSWRQIKLLCLRLPSNISAATGKFWYNVGKLWQLCLMLNSKYIPFMYICDIPSTFNINYLSLRLGKARYGVALQFAAVA